LLDSLKIESIVLRLVKL